MPYIHGMTNSRLYRCGQKCLFMRNSPPRRSKAVKPTTGYIGGGTAMQEVAVLRVCHIVNGHWWQTHAENPYFTPTRSPSESITFFETTWRVMGEFGVFCVVEKWNWHKEYYLRLTPLRALYAGFQRVYSTCPRGQQIAICSLRSSLCFASLMSLGNLSSLANGPENMNRWH